MVTLRSTSFTYWWDLFFPVLCWRKCKTLSLFMAATVDFVFWEFVWQVCWGGHGWPFPYVLFKKNNMVNQTAYICNIISKVKRVGNQQKEKVSTLQGWKRKYTLIFPSPVMHGSEDIMDSYTIAVSQENSKVTSFSIRPTHETTMWDREWIIQYFSVHLFSCPSKVSWKILGFFLWNLRSHEIYITSLCYKEYSFQPCK